MPRRKSRVPRRRSPSSSSSENSARSDSEDSSDSDIILVRRPPRRFSGSGVAAGAGEAEGPRRRRRGGARRRLRPGEGVLREIRRLRASTMPLIPLAPFARVVRDIMMQVAPPWLVVDLRVQLVALQALREAAELYVVNLLEDATLCAAHAGRVTLQPRDVRLVRRLRGVEL